MLFIINVLTSAGTMITTFEIENKWVLIVWTYSELHIDGLMQDCSNSIANTLELLQSCTKPWIYPYICDAQTGSSLCLQSASILTVTGTGWYNHDQRINSEGYRQTDHMALLGTKIPKHQNKAMQNCNLNSCDILYSGKCSEGGAYLPSVKPQLPISPGGVN